MPRLRNGSHYPGLLPTRGLSPSAIEGTHPHFVASRSLGPAVSRLAREERHPSRPMALDRLRFTPTASNFIAVVNADFNVTRIPSLLPI